MKKIRLLKANEIECRVGQCGKSMKGVGWCSILLYKDARCDMRLMDETFGVMGWSKHYETINGNLFCTVSVQDELGNWISRQDVGTESNTEKEKGQASDAFKRACVNWGIGRELYTSPKIYITLSPTEIIDKNGKYALSPKVTFTVAEIGYDDNRNINALIIVDNNGTVRYKMGTSPSATETSDNDYQDQFTNYIKPALEQARSREEITRIWNDYPDYHAIPEFVTAVTERSNQISNAA